MERSLAFRVQQHSCCAIIKRRQYHYVHLAFENIQGLDHGKRVRANGQMFADDIQARPRQQPPPTFLNGCFDLVGNISSKRIDQLPRP